MPRADVLPRLLLLLSLCVAAAATDPATWTSPDEGTTDRATTVTNLDSTARWIIIGCVLGGLVLLLVVIVAAIYLVRQMAAAAAMSQSLSTSPPAAATTWSNRPVPTGAARSPNYSEMVKRTPPSTFSPPTEWIEPARRH